MAPWELEKSEKARKKGGNPPEPGRPAGEVAGCGAEGGRREGGEDPAADAHGRRGLGHPQHVGEPPRPAEVEHEEGPAHGQPGGGGHEGGAGQTPQAEISRQKLAAKVGTEQVVLVDEVDGGKAIARTRADAPEIDGVVVVKGAKGARPGDFLRVKVTSATDHDLAGSVVAAAR